MFHNFSDYMYYLLTTPFKRVQKSANSWYTLCVILGAWFDECLDDIHTARKEGMLAACSSSMLDVHAADRDLSRYPGETELNFRKRISWYTELKRMGGTDQGVLLTVKTLGYAEPLIMRAVELTGDETRWAEFYIIIENDIDYQEPITFDILRKEVRKVKYSAAKENFLFRYYLQIVGRTEKLAMRHRSGMIMYYYDYLRLDGSWNLNGRQLLDSSLRVFEVDAGSRINFCGNEECIHTITRVVQHNFWTLDGSRVLDGRTQLDAYKFTEELFMKQVITDIKRRKLAEATHTTGKIPVVKYIAIGSGGANADGDVLSPKTDGASLNNELLRREYNSSRKISDNCYEYTIIIGADELVGEFLSEIALVDEDGDIVAISNFLPKGKDTMEDSFAIQDLY